MNTQEFEDLLKRAPAPAPPPGLEQRLLSSIALPAAPSHSAPPQTTVRHRLPRELGIAAGIVAALVITLGGIHTSRLAERNEQLTRSLEELQRDRAADSQPDRVTLLQQEIQRLRDQTRELHQLRAEVAALRPLIGEIETLRQENQRILESMARQIDPPAQAQTPIPEPNEEEAQSLACLNHLKHIGLAARIWAGDNGDVFPPDLISMANELSTPMVLHCPADAQRPVMSNWAQFQPHLSSYEYLNPNGSEIYPHVVLARCQIHGHVALSDGRVLGGQAFSSGNRQLTNRNGQLELVVPEAEQDDPNSPGYYERLMLKRYGLSPRRSNADGAATNAPPGPKQSQEPFW